MKIIVLTFIVLLSIVYSSSYGVRLYEKIPAPADTIEIYFGDKGKIIIQVESKEDLELLKDYDVNEMLEDIDMDEHANDSTDIIIIEDRRGEKYLKSDDWEEDSEFSDLEDEFDQHWGDRDADNDVSVTIDTNDDHVIVAPTNQKQRIGAGTDFVSFFDLGMNNYVGKNGFPDANDEQYTVRPWGSWSVELKAGLQTHVTGKFALDYGAGFSWYNFKYQDPDTRMIKGEDAVIFTTWEPELKASKSKLTVSYINAHFVPVFDFGYRKRVKTYDDGTTISRVRYNRNGFRIGLGGYAGYRIGSHSKVVWNKDGKKSKGRENNNFYLNNFRYGIRMIVGYGEVDFFVNYDLNELYASGRGPQLNAFSFGISF